MRIVDAQVHIWQSDNPDRPWPPGNAGRAHRPVPLEADGLLQEMDSAGVERAILVPPSWEGDRNDLSIAAARRHPGDRRSPLQYLPGRKELLRAGLKALPHIR